MDEFMLLLDNGKIKQFSQGRTPQTQQIKK